MEETVIRMVGSKLIVEISLAKVFEAVAESGKLALDITPAQVIQAVRDAAPKPSMTQGAAKPGPKPGPKPATPTTA